MRQAVNPIKTFGDLGVNARSFARSLRAENLSARTEQTYMEAITQFGRFLSDQGMPQDVASVHREHVEAFIADLLGRFKPRSY